MPRLNRCSTKGRDGVGPRWRQGHSDAVESRGWPRRRGCGGRRSAPKTGRRSRTTPPRPRSSASRNSRHAGPPPPTSRPLPTSASPPSWRSPISTLGCRDMHLPIRNVFEPSSALRSRVTPAPAACSRPPGPADAWILVPTHRAPALKAHSKPSSPATSVPRVSAAAIAINRPLCIGAAVRTSSSSRCPGECSAELRCRRTEPGYVPPAEGRATLT